jgi:hypothetical protein
MAEMSDLYQKLWALSGHRLVSGFGGTHHRPFGLMLLT